MSGLEPLGKLLIAIGLTLVILGALAWLMSKVGFLGDLPGDIRIQRDGVTCLIPLASSIILSILLTIVLNVIVRLLNR